MRGEHSREVNTRKKGKKRTRRQEIIKHTKIRLTKRETREERKKRRVENKKVGEKL
jgi:hypothetical protein